MKKLLALTFILAACSSKAPNSAELLVLAQAPTAKCGSAVIKDVEVTVCDVPGKDKIVQFVGAYQKGKLPFQAFPLSDGTEKKEAEGQGAGANAAPAPTATPDAGVGSGSGGK